MKYGLIGRTLTHSYSKEIHEALGKYEYALYSLEPDELPNFINSRDFGGLNVTIPYKRDVIPLCDEISELAAAIGSVNTLYFNNGKLTGHNTDYEGFLYTASRSGINFAGRNVLILGNGGTSLTARKAIADQGADTIYIASRSLCKTDTCNMLMYDELPGIADRIEIIVNTTPVGTYPNNMQKVISLAAFPACRAVIDVIYNPAKTALLLEAESLGLKTANGFPMLVAQATAAAGYFLGTPGVFTSENERIIKQLESQMRNIVLIGMPGCGKSTIGRLLAKNLGKKFIDMDDEIIKLAGMPIPEIFSRFGEEHFRTLESEVAAALGKERGLIIATGGGAVLRSSNTDCLKQNSLMMHIMRPVESLPSEGRPLSQNPAALRQMQSVRMPLYKEAADIEYNNSKFMSEDDLINDVMNVLKGVL